MHVHKINLDLWHGKTYFFYMLGRNLVWSFFPFYEWGNFSKIDLFICKGQLQWEEWQETEIEIFYLLTYFQNGSGYCWARLKPGFTTQVDNRNPLLRPCHPGSLAGSYIRSGTAETWISAHMGFCCHSSSLISALGSQMKIEINIIALSEIPSKRTRFKFF